MTIENEGIKRVKLLVIEGDKSQEIYGSDFRKQSVEGNCVLCGNSDRLALSHIAPKWAHKWMKGEGYIVEDIKSLGVRAKSKDGSKHFLLCSKCEQLMGRYERYVSQFCTGGKRNFDDLGIEVVRDDSGVRLFGVSEEKVTKFLTGILLKAHFAPSAPWTKITVPADWIEFFRKYLLGEPCSTGKFEVMGFRHFSTVEPAVNPKAMIFPLFDLKKNVWMFEIMIGGWDFKLFFLRTPKMKIPSGWTMIDRLNFVKWGHLILRDGEWWKVAESDILANHFVNDKWESFDENSSGVVGDDEECSCGMVSLKFKECCKPLWYA